jgi:type IV pilus assembly protein PilM
MRSFFDFFPTPSYLKAPVYAFDLSDRSIKYLRLFKKSGRFFLDSFGERIIPEGFIVSGEIKKKNELIGFLKAFQKEFRTNYINVILPEEKAFLSRVQLPKMDIGEIKGALEVQLEEHIPLSPSEVVFDFDVVEDKEHLDVNLIAFPKTVIQDYRDVFLSSGFRPLAFEMEAHAIARSVVPNNKKEVFMIIDFGRTHTSFIIVDNGKVKFSSSVKIAGTDLSMAISKTLSVGIGEAERIKKEKGFLNAAGNEKVYKALLPAVSTLLGETNRLYSFWASRIENHGGEKRSINKILLSGGDSNLSGLPEFISRGVKIPVELANPWVNTFSFDEQIPEMTFKESLIYAAAIGLAVRSF